MDLANEGSSQPIEIDWFWVAGALPLIGCGWTDFEGTLVNPSPVGYVFPFFLSSRILASKPGSSASQSRQLLPTCVRACAPECVWVCMPLCVLVCVRMFVLVLGSSVGLQ